MPIPELPQTDVPRVEAPASDWAHHLSGMFLRMRGWTMGGAAPKLDKYVLIAAPHTEWWDGFWMLCFSSWWGVRMNWLAKKSVMRWPVAGLLRRTGIVPVDRSAPQGLVGQIVEQFEQRERMVLAIPPEGTRGLRDYWKSGFYHMARQANVPICLSYLDFKTRVAGFGPCFDLTGNVRADMDRVREFYAGIEGKIPENFTPPRLREEDEVAEDGDAPGRLAEPRP